LNVNGPGFSARCSLEQQRRDWEREVNEQRPCRATGQKRQDNIHTKDGNGKIVCSADAFAWIREARGYKFLPILGVCPSSKGPAGAFYRLFAYRCKLSGEKLVCGSEGDHPPI
jgi:hypothetical protein